jgi:tetratricopeptide (TPR) repeat protein
MTLPATLDLTHLLAQLDVRVALHPRYADWRNLRGLARAYAGREDEARADFDAALAVNPRYQAAHINRAWLEAVHGVAPAEGAALTDAWRSQLRWVASVQLDREAACMFSPSPLPAPASDGPWSPLNRLWFAVHTRDRVAVETALESLIEQEPRVENLLRDLGITAGAGDAVFETWASLYRGNPQVASLCHAAAEIARAGEEFDRSAALLAWGAVVSLDLCAYGMGLAVHLDAAGRESESRAALEAAVAADPSRATAHAALAQRHATDGDLAAAIAAMERATALAPRYPDLRYELGLLYRDAGRARESERELRAALAARPEYVLAQLALGTLLQECGRDAEALPFLQRVRRAGLRSADIEMRLAAAHARLGHVNHARRAAARARAVARSGGMPAPRVTLSERPKD